MYQKQQNTEAVRNRVSNQLKWNIHNVWYLSDVKLDMKLKQHESTFDDCFMKREANLSGHDKKIERLE